MARAYLTPLQDAQLADFCLRHIGINSKSGRIPLQPFKLGNRPSVAEELGQNSHVGKHWGCVRPPLESMFFCFMKGLVEGAAPSFVQRRLLFCCLDLSRSQILEWGPLLAHLQGNMTANEQFMSSLKATRSTSSASCSVSYYTVDVSCLGGQAERKSWLGGTQTWVWSFSNSCSCSSSISLLGKISIAVAGVQGESQPAHGVHDLLPPGYAPFLLGEHEQSVMMLQGSFCGRAVSCTETMSIRR